MISFSQESIQISSQMYKKPTAGSVSLTIDHIKASYELYKVYKLDTYLSM